MGGQAEERRVVLLRDGQRVDHFTVGRDQSVLAAADATAVDMQYGCRDGSCVRCIGRLLEGEITYTLEPSALSADQREAGFVLLCVVRPVTDCRFEIGRAVLEGAFPQLWRRDSGFR